MEGGNETGPTPTASSSTTPEKSNTSHVFEMRTLRSTLDTPYPNFTMQATSTLAQSLQSQYDFGVEADEELYNDIATALLKCRF
eukprot:3358038-Ditylum_brightwellii.AAC.1